MDKSDLLQVGARINVHRSDGRVHSAIIAFIEDGSRIATVTWEEQGETKCKEVDLNAIENLNPNVKLPAMTSLEANPISKSVMKLPPARAFQQDPTRQSCKRTTGIAIPSYKTIRNGHAGDATSKFTSAGSCSSRRTNVVREIEKLKCNREERRQRQAQVRAEKGAFLQMAPGNPHWELQNMINEYRSDLEFKPLTGDDPIEDHLITVCVRKRPLNRQERARREIDVVTVPSKNQLIVHEPKSKLDLTKYLENQLFRFDYAFDETCSNEMVYRYTAQPLIRTIFEGGYATCFAYGQTGSGKTHTMGGDFKKRNQDCENGIYVLAAADVFRLARSSKYQHLNLVVSSSFFEIYSGNIFDLLNKKAKLKILEDGKQQVQVVGLTETIVRDTEDVMKLIQRGSQSRTSGQTFANLNSSRSHAIFQIYLRPDKCISKIHGKFSLIDLAGNERGADTSTSNKRTRMEGAEINKSLLALKECIRALARKGAHLPFRASKLTQVLRDSFVGSNSRTCMIAMISPGVNSCEYSLNTLRYADRVKELRGGELRTNSGCDTEEVLATSNECDMLDLHQFMSELETAEENMLENHRQLIDQTQAVLQRETELRRTADGVDYDQADYCESWSELIDGFMQTLGNAKEVLEDYKAKLAVKSQNY